MNKKTPAMGASEEIYKAAGSIPLPRILEVLGQYPLPLIQDGAHEMLFLSIDAVPRRKHIPYEQLAEMYPRPEDREESIHEKWLQSLRIRERNAQLVISAGESDRRTVAQAKKLPAFKGINKIVLKVLSNAESEGKLQLYYVPGKPEAAERDMIACAELHRLRGFLHREVLNVGTLLAPKKGDDRRSDNWRDWLFFYTMTGTPANRHQMPEFTGLVYGFNRGDLLYAFIFEIDTLDLVEGSNAEWCSTLDTMQGLNAQTDEQANGKIAENAAEEPAGEEGEAEDDEEPASEDSEHGASPEASGDEATSSSAA